MKSAIIIGYFVGMFILGIIGYAGVSSWKISHSINTSIFQDYRTLSDDEVIKDRIERHDGKKYVMYFEIVESRKLTSPLTWKSHLDTSKVHIEEESL